MKKSRLFGLFVCLGVAVFTARGVCAQASPLYLNPRAPIKQRINDLLKRMTVEEKISQISNDQGSAGIPRLKVPALWKTEAIHGQEFSTGATIFPQAIAMGATFDPALVERVARETGAEAKAAFARSAWAPVLNVARDVRWGRVEETYGESPYLVTRMGVAWIDGFQSEGLIAVPKHFVVHGEPLGGRDSNDVGLSDRVMREIFLPGFRAAVEEAHAGGIMPAYSSWQGVPDNASQFLLQKILRQEWGFDGIVVSDCGALANFYTKQGVAGSMAEAAALGIKAGVNLNCGRTYREWAAIALRQGLISEMQLDDAVRPMLRAKFRLGLFENPVPGRLLTDKLPEYDSPTARATARQVEVEAAVLLKNDNDLLPLKKDLRAIAVIGPDAEDGQTGDYSPRPAPGQVISVLEGIRSHVGPQTKVLFAAGLDKATATDMSKFPEAIAAARQADVAIVVAGDNSRPHGGKATTGEGEDSATLDLPGAQHELIKAIQETGTPVVLVLVNGKPFAMDWEAEHIPAILETWFPGEEGGDATADLLFGDRNPSGRLPITWPRSVGQLPLHYDDLPTGRKYSYADMQYAPQWRFGYGLSYTRFRYSNLRVAEKAGDPGFVTVSADVQNVGSRDGDEVSQLYISDLVASTMTPLVELKGFERISLKAGTMKTVQFELTPYDLSLLDTDMVRRVEPGVFRVHIGGVVPGAPDNAVDQRKEKIGFDGPAEGVSGEFTEPKPYAAEFMYTLDAPAKAKRGEAVPVTATVHNNGDLTDVTETKLYRSSFLDSWSFELRPGQTKSHVFHVVIASSGTLTLVAGSQVVTKQIKVE
jgi:beta-glucosidase